MSKETDLVLFEPEDPNKRKRELLDSVNDRLRVNNTDDEELTIQDLARKLQIDTRDLYQWADTDPEFKKGLQDYKDNQDDGAFKQINNRADALAVMTLLEQMQKKHK
jgi:hypothetical protein